MHPHEKKTISHYQAQRPRDLHIVVRKPSYEYKSSLEANHYWYKNDPFGTHFLNALQSIFPEGELFFVHSAVDGFKILKQHNNISNQMKKDLKLFQQQEARHSQQHRLWTRALIQKGYHELTQYNKELHNVDSWIRRHISAKWRIAMTAAAEHYTASLAYVFTYVNQDFITKSAFPFNDVLLYHAIEEVEHKSVCFNLSQMFSRCYLRRIISFAFISFDLTINTYTRMKYLLKKDGLWSRRYRGNILNFFTGKNGLLRGLLKRVLHYLHPSFHPWSTDERKSIEEIFGNFLNKNNIQSFKFK